MNLTKIVAALAIIMMMTVVVAPAVSAEDSVDFTATVLEPKPEIGIDLNATALSFGSLYPGYTSEPQDLKVTNIGLKEIDVTATASDDGTEPLFVPGLLIDNAAYGDYSATLAADESDDTQLALHVPDDYASRGAVSGGATFWAEEHLYLPEANFSADVTSGTAPLTVQFTDMSTNAPTSWSWDFDNDGTVDSYDQNPSFTFNEVGIYTISLTSSNTFGNDTETKSAYVNAAVKLNIYSTSEENTNPGAPDPGIPGFIGPDGDGKTGGNNVVNPAFTAWASKVIDWSPTGQEIGEQWKDPTKALGPVTGNNFNIVSLGDLDQVMIITGELPGSLTLGFDVTIVNGPGPDFAAFENGFMSGGGLFAELGYVEVSSDGVTFARFPSVSLTPGQAGGYGSLDATYLYNLVGKHVNAYGDSWGTPFDLSDLTLDLAVLNGSVDLNNINYVRIVDIPGSGDFKDSLGNPIYDAWVTWGSGGVDFEALGVLNSEVKTSPATDFTTTSDGSAISITGYVGPGGNVFIPDEINGVPVTSIGKSAFQSNTNMTSVIISDSVTSIGKYAFRDCNALASVTISDSVTSIGKYAFRDCNALASVIIGSGVTDMDINTFSGLNALTSIDIDTNNSAYASVDGVLYDKAVTMLILCPRGKTSITIPDSVLSIDSYSVHGCTALTSVTIPDSVTTIDGYAFQECTALTTVTIGSGVTNIGDSAFHGCTALTSVTIPDSVTTINSSSFQECTSLTTVTIGSGVTNIGQGAFRYCTALTAINVDVNNGAYSSLDGVLYNKAAYTTLVQCPLLKATIVIPATVKIIGESAFEYNNALTSVTIPDSVIYIGRSAFSNCANLTSITIPGSVTIVDGSAFHECTSLASVTIGNGVTRIGNSAFDGCTALTSVTIPNSVTTIDGYAFQECTSLTSMTFEGNAPTVGTDWAQNVPTTMIVYYHPGATGFTNPWEGFTTVELTP